MNYANLIYNKIRNVSFSKHFCLFLLILFGNKFVYFGVLCITIFIIKVFIGSVVVFCVHDHILKICLNIFWKHVPEV